MRFIKRIAEKLLLNDKMFKDSKKAMELFEKYNCIKNNKTAIFTKFYLARKYKRICFKYNSYIPLKAKIGKNVFFPHGLCEIFISQGAVIGDNCTIFQQVTIGSSTFEDSKGWGIPKIGNNVYVGAGAKIIGNVKIGNNVRIGANAVVVEDVPDNATVVLSKPRIILHDHLRKNSFSVPNINDRE